MYKIHFGFKEKPFQLVPNPAYLFLSKSHEEALAHLNYAICQGDGFVQITGEVGTGKTTLCRAFIEGLDPHIEVAYLFNPTLDAIELLEALHDEWAIPYERGATPKRLIDSLNAFLLEKKGQGQKVLLVIDEAQHLKKEVLEQIRLLSNLETHTEKLLQIVLVGQPELADMLSSYALRQLGQRITLCASLRPLSFRETVRFIEHRLHIAAQGVQVAFTRRAYRTIFRYARGIPRRIHIVCDRALLVAYVLNQHRVTGPVVKTAIRELSEGGKRIPGRRLRARTPMLLATVLAAVLLGVAGWRLGCALISTPAPTFLARMLPTTSPAVTATPSASPTLPYAGRYAALERVLSLWGRPIQISTRARAIHNDAIFFWSAVKDNGFNLYRVNGDFDLIKKLDLPAILACYVPDANAVEYLVLERIAGDAMTFLGPKPADKVVIKRQTAAAHWSGTAYVPWINFLGIKGTLTVDSPKQSVRALKQLMRDIGFKGIAPGAAYDATIQAAIKKFQDQHDLEEDGLVGPKTKILLYNERGIFDMPHLIGGGKG